MSRDVAGSLVLCAAEGAEMKIEALCKELSDSPLAPGDARSFNHPIFVKE